MDKNFKKESGKINNNEKKDKTRKRRNIIYNVQRYLMIDDKEIIL